MARAGAATLTVLAAFALGGCAGGEEWQGAPPNADYAEFEASVYPVLLRDCAFSECHGGEQRFFHIYGPGRSRIDPALEPTDPATAEEVLATYQRAVSMLATDRDVARSLLLTKPLEGGAGGQGHRGLDALGRNVYSTTNDPGYAALRAWSLRAAHGSGSATP